MSGWATLLARILDKALKALPAILAYFRGRKDAADKSERIAKRDAQHAEARQEESDREFEVLDNDADLTRRMRELRNSKNTSTNRDVQE